MAEARVSVPQSSSGDEPTRHQHVATLTTEGYLQYIDPKENKIWCPLYFVIAGCHVKVYFNKPTSPDEPPHRSGLITGHYRVASLGCEDIQRGSGSEAEEVLLYTFHVYSLLNKKKSELKLGAESQEEVARWIKAVQAGVDFPKTAVDAKRAAQEVPWFVLEELEAKFGKEGMSPTHDESEEINLAMGGRMDGADWKLTWAENGLRFFHQMPRATKSSLFGLGRPVLMLSIGIVLAHPDKLFNAVMNLKDHKERRMWDATFERGEVVERVDDSGYQQVIRIIQDNGEDAACLPFSRHAELVCMRFWKREDDGRYLIYHYPMDHPPYNTRHRKLKINTALWLFQPLTPFPGGLPRTKVIHALEMKGSARDTNRITGWKQSRLHFRMLNRVASLRDYFQAQHDVPVSGTPVQTGYPTTAEPVMPKPTRPLEHGLTRTATLQRNTALSFDEATRGEKGIVEEFMDALPDLAPVADSPPSPAPVEASINSQRGQSFKVDATKFQGSLSSGPLEGAKDAWAQPPGKQFMVRGKSYLTDRKKVAARDPMLKLVAVDWLESGTNGKLTKVASQPNNKVMEALNGLAPGPQMLVVNLQVPGSKCYSMVFYFLLGQQLVPDSLLQLFFDGSAAFRNKHLKLIPRVHDGSWLVKSAVGSKPAIIGKALVCSYERGPRFLEVEIDVGSSKVAAGIVGLVIGYVTSLTIDMAFTLEGQREEDLPEILIGAVRVSRLDLKSAVTMS